MFPEFLQASFVDVPSLDILPRRVVEEDVPEGDLAPERARPEALVPATVDRRLPNKKYGF